MRNKIKIIFSVLLFSIINFQCQNMKKETIDVSQAIVKIDSCGLTYKGKKLELGTPIEDWIKVLGKPSRDTELAYVWDDLGIAIDDWQNNNKEVAGVYIFFLNLDSPEGKSQQLNHARDFESGENIAARNMEGGKSLISDDQIKKFNAENELKKKNYIYPFKVHPKVVDLNGFPVKAGMKVEEINSYRTNLPYSGKFGYVDDDIDGVNDSGTTTETFGGDYRAPGAECKDGRLQYYELTYTATKKLEYLKIGLESKSDHDSRKVSEASFEERKKKK